LELSLTAAEEPRLDRNEHSDHWCIASLLSVNKDTVRSSKLSKRLCGRSHALDCLRPRQVSSASKEKPFTTPSPSDTVILLGVSYTMIQPKFSRSYLACVHDVADLWFKLIGWLNAVLIEPAVVKYGAVKFGGGAHVDDHSQVSDEGVVDHERSVLISWKSWVSRLRRPPAE